MNTTHTAAALATAATLALAGVASAQQNQQQQDRQQQMDQKDMAQVSIKRSSTWGFSNEVRKYLSDAYEDMYVKPEEAIQDLKLAVGMTEILAAAAEDQGEALQSAADELSRFAQKLENRQVANADELSKPAASVVLAIAKVQQAEAQKGLEQGDESAFAYSLDSAAENLFQAHVYLKQAPDEEAGKAIFDAARLGKQVKSLIEPTSGQGAQYTVAVPEEQKDMEDIDLLENAQLASSTSGDSSKPSVAQQIPTVAPGVVKALGDAINAAEQVAKSADPAQE